MMLYLEVMCDVLTCVNFFRSRDMDYKSARRLARDEGWVTIEQEGRLMDFCPTCARVVKDKKRAAGAW